MFTNGCSFKEALFKGAISGTAVGLDFLKVNCSEPRQSQKRGLKSLVFLTSQTTL